MASDPRAVKMLSEDRILVLKVREGGPKSSTGIVDHRLFNGDNKLHAMFDKEYSMWYLKYDSGKIPPQLDQKWTSFPKLLETTTGYFNKRNIDIKEVID